MLIVSGRSILTETDLQTIFRTLIAAINEENDMSTLSALYKSVVDSMLVTAPQTVPSDISNDIVHETEKKLHTIAQKRKFRAEHLLVQDAEDSAEDQDDVRMLEELEDFVLDEVARFLGLLNSNHPVLIAVSSVRQLGVIRHDDDEL
jgi:hypothetical protein